LQQTYLQKQLVIFHTILLKLLTGGEYPTYFIEIDFNYQNKTVHFQLQSVSSDLSFRNLKLILL
jgi:hypothetical protein